MADDSKKPSRHELKEEIRRARANLRDDLAALDHHINVEAPQKVHDNGPIIAAAAGSLALVIGFGGWKLLKQLLVIGAAAGAAALIAQKVVGRRAEQEDVVIEQITVVEPVPLAAAARTDVTGVNPAVADRLYVEDHEQRI